MHSHDFLKELFVPATEVGLPQLLRNIRRGRVQRPEVDLFVLLLLKMLGTQLAPLGIPIYTYIYTYIGIFLERKDWLSFLIPSRSCSTPTILRSRGTLRSPINELTATSRAMPLL